MKYTSRKKNVTKQFKQKYQSNVQEAGQYLKDRIESKIKSQELVDTGQYLNSWQVKVFGENNISVFTDVPYSQRLELGFYGEDALGRIYSQAPTPHIRPAFEESKQEILRILSEGE